MEIRKIYKKKKRGRREMKKEKVIIKFPKSN